MKDKFQFVNGYVTLSNDFLVIDRSFRLKDDNMTFYAIASIAIIATFIDQIKDYELISGFWGYFKLVFYGITVLFILYSIYHLIFRKHWSNQIQINEISIIEMDDEHEFEIELTIATNRKKEKVLRFRKLENQLEPFLESLKKRNSRFEIKYL